MEKMAYQAHLELRLSPTELQTPATVTNDWRTGLPSLTGTLVSLRELRATDAAALFSALSGDQVTKFISPPPATVDGFGRFINWAIRQRQAGQYVCFAVVPHDSDTAIGIFQVRSLEPAFGTAEWGFALASEFWGTGIFVDGAKLVVDFAFAVLGVHRLEARAALKNSRGNGSLQKLGAVQEAILRRSFLKNDEYLDQALWTIFRNEWMEAKTVRVSRVIH
jgi:ribosomal-protein-alanine N-acetyltransferase